MSAQPPDPLAVAMKALDDNKPAEALAILKPLAAQEPKNLPALFNLGLAHSLLAQDAEAATAFTQVLAIEPGLYGAQLNLGQILLRLKKPADAQPWIEKALQQRPKELRPNLLLGDCLLDRKDFPAAEKHARAALEIDPASVEAWSTLGRALDGQNRPEEAAAAFDKSNDQPAAAAIRERRAVELLQSGKAADAAALLERVVAQAPTTASRYALAVARLRAGDRAAAKAQAEEILKSEPANFEPRMFLGRLLRDDRLFAPAAQQFIEAVKLKPESIEAWSELSGMLIMLKQYPQALASLDKLKSQQGETAAYWWFRATILDALKDAKQALPAYERFLQLSQGKSPDEEFKARQRARILEKMVRK